MRIFAKPIIEPMKKKIANLFAGLPWYDAAEYGAMILITLTVPIAWSIGVWSLILLCLATLVKCIQRRRVGNSCLSRGGRAGLWLMIAYFALSAVSALWSSQPAEAWERAALMLPMLALPLAMLLTDTAYLKQRHTDALVFLLAGVLTVRFAVMAVRAIVRYLMGIPPSLLIDFHFDPLHHNYLALYLITAIALLYVVVERNWHRADWRRWRWVVVADMALLAGYMVIMGSRSGLVILAMVAVACLAHLALVRKRWGVAAVAAGLLVVGVGATYLAAPKLYWRIVYSAEKMLAGEPGDGRQVMWQCGMELVKERPLTGWGSDGYWPELRERYRAHDFAEGYEPERYNTHNQYLETLLMTGSVGLAVLMMMVMVPAVASCCKPRRNLPMALFTIVYGGFLMFEVMFGRQMGLLFICWWYGLLLAARGTETAEK